MPVTVQAAAAVGEHQDLRPAGRRGPYAVHHGVHAATLVEVGATGEDAGDLAGRGPDRTERATVTCDARCAEAGQIRQGQLTDGLTEVVGGGRPARPQHHGQVQSSQTQPFQQGVRGVGRSRLRVLVGRHARTLASVAEGGSHRSQAPFTNRWRRAGSAARPRSLRGPRPPRRHRPGCRGCGHWEVRPRSRSARRPRPCASPSSVATRTRTLRYSPESALSQPSRAASSASVTSYSAT